MININTYIIEKLTINKDSKLSRKELIDTITDIINSSLTKYKLNIGSYRISMMNNEDERYLVNEPEKCNVISLNFTKKTIAAIEEEYNKKFIKFLQKLKVELEKEFATLNITVKLAKNMIDNRDKIHILLNE